jgi:TRAP-type C4-dicarboxylate transport system substrate-binding protein
MKKQIFTRRRTEMKKRIFRYATMITVALALVAGLILVGAEPSQAAEQVFKLRYQGKWVGHEKQNWAIEQLKFADRVKAATNGRVTIENMDEVARDNEVLDSVRRGVIDIGAQPMHSRGELDLVNFITLPFVEFDKMPEMYNKLRPMLDGYWDKQFNVQQLGYNFFLPARIFTRKPCTTLEDIKSMKLRIGGNILVQLFKLAGGNPIVMNQAEVYQSIQRGIIDGAHTAIPGYLSGGWYEICKYISDWPVGSMGLAVIMNKDSWNKLGPTLQGQLMSAWSETEKAQWDGVLKDISAMEKEAFSKGAVYNNPSKVEKDKFLSFSGPVIQEWKAKTGANGLTVMKTINEVLGTNY